MKFASIVSLRTLVSGTAIGLAALLSVTVASTSAVADGHEMAANIANAADQLEWAPLGDRGAQISLLWGDPTGDDYAAFIKIPPGFTPGPHSHTGDYHGINLQGTWVHIIGDDDVRSLPPGSYVMQSGGGLHNDACAGPDECILFIHQHTPRDFIPAAAAGN